MKKQKLALILLVLIFLISTSARLSLLKTHFGHLDDLGVAATILSAKRNPPTIDSLLAEGKVRTSSRSASPRLKALATISANPFGKRVLQALMLVFPYLAVPLYWTYAPLQFIVTSLLLNLDQSYESIKFWGRFPSLISSSFAMFFMVALAQKIQSRQWITWSLLLVSPLAFSLEISIMSSQMHNYALGVAVAAGVLWLAVKDAKQIDQPREKNFWLRRVFLWALALYSIYQSILLLPGYLAAQIGASMHLPFRQRRLVIGKWCNLGIVIVLIFLPAYLFRVQTTAAISWNAGPNQEFLFHNDGSFLVSAVRYFAVNGPIVIGSIMTPAVQNSAGHSIWTPLFSVFVVIGILRSLVLLYRKDTKVSLKALCCASLVGLAVLVVAVLSQKLVLSPTRHLTLYAPILTVLFAQGLVSLVSLHNKLSLSFVAVMMTMALGFTFLSGFTTFRLERQDLFTENILTTLVERERPDLVISMSTEALLMPSLRAKVPIYSHTDLMQATGGARDFLKELYPNSKRILIVGTSPLNIETCPLCNDLFKKSISSRFDVHLVRTLIDQQTDTEIELSRHTRNGPKGIFVGLFDEPPQ